MATNLEGYILGFLSSKLSPDALVPCVSGLSFLSSPRQHFFWPFYSLCIVKIFFRNFVQLVHHVIVLFFQKMLTLRSEIDVGQCVCVQLWCSHEVALLLTC